MIYNFVFCKWRAKIEKEIIATFIGCKECFDSPDEAVRAELIKLFEQGVSVFLNGGMGAFD